MPRKSSDVLTVACSKNTTELARDVFFLLKLYHSSFLQIPLNEISHGLAFHPRLSPNPPDLYKDPASVSLVQDMVHRRVATLRQKAEDEAENNPAASSELRQKAARYEADALPTMLDEDKYVNLLGSVANTLDKIEEQLTSTLSLEDECPGWLLGPSFSAVDIALAVILNKLALLGFQERFWARGRRPHIHKFLKEIQRRASFSKSIPDIGSATGRMVSIQEDTAVMAQESGGNGVRGGGQQGILKKSYINGTSEENPEGWKTTTVEDGGDGITVEEPAEKKGIEEERTWKSLW